MAGGARVAREELDEAPSVAMAMNASAALFYSTRALDCFAETSLPRAAGSLTFHLPPGSEVFQARG